MLKAVAFDLDGTLLNTIRDIAAALNTALAECGFPTYTPREVEGLVGGGIRDAVFKACPAGTPVEVVEKVLSIYRPVYRDHCVERTAPYPGVETLLRTLADRGVPMAVLTNKSEDTARRIISHFFPDIPFVCVHGRVDGYPLKPDAGAAARLLEKTGLQPGDIAFVGDSGVDMTFAVNTGMLPVAAPWGFRSREQLVECGARLVADDPAHLLQLLLEQL